MAMTIDEISDLLTESGIGHETNEPLAAIRFGFHLDPSWTNYRNPAGAATHEFMIGLHGDGEFLAVHLPRTWMIGDCPHKAAVFEVLATYQGQRRMIRFDYDPEDGEIRANMEIWLADTSLSAAQLQWMIRQLGRGVCRLDPVIRHAMRTGEVSFERSAEFDEDRETERVGELARAAGGLEALERLVGGGDAPDGPDPARRASSAPRPPLSNQTPEE
jgi:hypothetical protein